MKKMTIILASGSPWRKRLLRRHGIDCKIHVSNFKEKFKGTNFRLLAIYNAVGKAKAIAKHYKNGIIIGVDTIGILGKKLLFKPKHRADAARMIRTLSGHRHKVISGLCVMNVGTGKIIKTAVSTHVTFRKVSESELERYLDSMHWKGKAGAYAIQGRARGFVEKIEGDITNVVGLPIETLKKCLAKVAG